MMSIFSADSFTAPVLITLVSVILSAAAQLFAGTMAAWAAIAVCSLLCGFFSLFLCTLPVILYDSLREKKPFLLLPACTVLLRHQALSVPQLIMTAAAAAIAVILYMRISGLEKQVGKLSQLRDETAEKNSLLSEQNIRLAHAQDNEITLATMKERNRIAREIHDNVGHLLTRSLLQSGAIIVINKDEQLREPLESLRSTLDSAMTSIRNSVHDLHDDSISLRNVITESISTVDSRFTVSFDCNAEENMPGSIKLCFIGVVKEGLSNAVKHSTGDKISIIIREHPAFYQLVFEDNGSCSEIKESGIGLSNMRDRAASLNGRISFTPSPQGFKIFMSIPKSQQTHKEQI